MGAMWFCPALLLVSLLSFGMMRATRRKPSWHRHACFAAAFAVGAACCHWGVKSPYCLWQYLQICGIFYAGHLFRRRERLLASTRRRLACAAVACALLPVATACGLMARLQPGSINGENPAVLILVATAGSLGIYSLSALMARTAIGRALERVGNYSFSIMALHFLAFKAVSWLVCSAEGLDVQRLADFPVVTSSGDWWAAYLVAGIVLPMLTTYIIMRTKRLLLCWAS